ncbi:hypothetical protein EW145_g3428 [Phellinidium pouzarii]|uniref:Methyltransferase domain-containing protein n=1 Tax=Phellinidium pouzarii TaxID=167371 RepID=A0A4S4L940_9AGAM|nr:hypothetical protein EW145_g3428 [Phellinidium pouzarii]
MPGPNFCSDTIDHLILADMCGGLTLQILDTPPARVLDLGCGGGMWILAAAQQWKDTAFVGFDIHKRQPNLSRTLQADLSERVQWVHGNFLEPLPFADGEFDLARMQNIGLGVPEDEWQNVIDELVRVLKPGGSLEIIEEDITFPCPDTQTTRTPRASPTPRGQIPRAYPNSTRSQVCRNGEESHDKFVDESPSSNKSRSIDTVSGGRQDQRDHSKLKEAFMQMLNVRFINPQILTVLPFYLQAVLQEVQTIPGLQLFLPPPSGVVDIPESSDSDSNISVDSSSSTLVGSPSSTSSSAQPRWLSEVSQMSNFSHATVEPESLIRARIHLSRTVEVVRGCKEAMWAEYEKLHIMDRNVPNSRLDRDDFETYFHNWECDMQDRIGMRDAIRTRLGWPLPSMLPKPEWYDWREKGDNDDVAKFYADAFPEILRSLRGFVCQKPVLHDSHGEAQTPFKSTVKLI